MTCFLKNGLKYYERYKILYAKMLGAINSPASGIVGSINAVMAQLTRAMAAVRDQKAA